MSYSQHRDFNGEVIQEGIRHLYQREVSVSAPLTDFEVEVPSPRAYGVVFSYVPQGVKIKAKINDFDFVSIHGSGSQFSPVINGIKSLVITTQGTHAEKLELLFVE